MSIPQGLYLNISFWFNDIPRPVVCSTPAALVLFLFLLPHSLHDRASTILSISDCPALLHDFFLASGSLACTACTFIPLTPDHHFLAHCASFSSGTDTTFFLRSGLSCSRKKLPSPAFRQRAIRDPSTSSFHGSYRTAHSHRVYYSSTASFHQRRSPPPAMQTVSRSEPPLNLKFRVSGCPSW